MTEEDGQQAGASDGTAGANRANGEASAASSVLILWWVWDAGFRVPHGLWRVWALNNPSANCWGSIRPPSRLLV